LNIINPKKLLNSKWTAINPINNEKHFIVTDVVYDDNDLVLSCVLEAILTGNQSEIDWTKLKDSQAWQQGWQHISGSR